MKTLNDCWQEERAIQSRPFQIGLVLLALAGHVAAGDWGTLLSREDALAQLGSRDGAARRAALVRLAEVGVDQDVPYMLRLLRDEERAVRDMAEQALWGLWLRADDLVVKRLFVSSIEKIQRKNFEEAISDLDEIISYKPEFAEAWNKRGDAWNHLGDLDRALADYRQTLRINPYHFGAMQSCGEIWLERADARRSAEYFRRALDINPNLQFLEPILGELEERLENDRI